MGGGTQKGKLVRPTTGSVLLHDYQFVGTNVSDTCTCITLYFVVGQVIMIVRRVIRTWDKIRLPIAN